MDLSGSMLAAVGALSAAAAAVLVWLACRARLARRARSDLDSADAALQELAESVQAVLWRADAATFRCTYISRQVETLLGYPVERWVGEPFWEKVVHPADRERAVAVCREHIEKRRSFEIDYRLLAADGRIVWLRERVRVAERPDGSLELVGVALDVTQRKLAEALLDLQSRLFERVALGRPVASTLQLLADAVQELCPEMRILIILADDTGGRVECVSAGAVAGAGAASAGGAGGWSRPILGLGDAVLGAIACSYSEPRVPSAAERRVVDAAAELSAIVLGAARSRDALERQALAFSTIRDALVVSDPAGVILEWNPAAAALLGLPRGKAPARPLLELLGGKAGAPQSELAAAVAESLGKTGLFEGELPLHRGEEERTCQAVLVEVPGGKGTIAVLRDVTDRKRAQEASERLQESLRKSELMSALGSLVAGVAHEVRNPLFGISAALDTWEKTQVLDADGEEILEILRRQLARLGNLMQGLLEYGKPTARQLSRVAVGALAEEAVQACRPLAERGGVRVVCDLEPELPPIAVDPPRVVTALKNLLENAVQHSARGGEVRLAAARVTGAGGGWLRVSVEDRGPGFGEADLGRVFEPFFSRRNGGTGLGLSIVQNVVGQHGGRVAAGNREGGGGVLTMELPYVHG